MLCQIEKKLMVLSESPVQLRMNKLLDAFEDDDTKSISEVARLLDITARRSPCQTSVLHVVAK
jgi:hypothetical protein